MIGSFTILISLIFNFSHGQQFNQIPCTRIQRTDNSSYICTKVAECTVAKELFSTGKAVACGSENGVYFICCPVRPLTPAEIAIKKCKEYSRVLNGSVTISSQTTGKADTFFAKQDCYRIDELREGVRPAVPKEYPHMAAIGYNRYNNSFNHVQWLCGGTLISESFVLTVAHCVRTRIKEFIPKWVLLGDLELNSTKDEATPQIYSVLETSVHPNFDINKNLNDIALLKLNATVVFSPFIRPICLHTSPNISPTEKVASTIGWGKTDTNSAFSRRLMGTTLSLLADSLCENIFRERFVFYPQSMVCAGDLVTGSDACAGDSGGPLQIPMRGTACMWIQLGITSFGEACGARKPTGFTRVAHYIDWIQPIVWP